MANCYLYDIIEPNPFNLRIETWRQVLKTMQEPRWASEHGERIGFVETLEYHGLIAGYFANEGLKRGIQYSDDKRPVAIDNFTSFEHLFFAIFVDTSQLVLQHRNIYGYKNLGLQVIRENFLMLLAIFLRLAGVMVVGERVKIASAGETYSQEELYQFFIENDVIRIDLRNLSSERIPARDDSRYRLFNPRDELNEITWLAVADTLKVGARNITVEASEEDADAQLNKGPITKAFTEVGEIEEISARSSSGKIVVKKRTRDEEITIELPEEPEIAIPALDLILTKYEKNYRLTSWKKRISKAINKQFGGPLFNQD